MISVSDLTMQFGQQVLFENVNFQLNKGNRYGLVGANGAGKSTLMKIITGEVSPESGVINIPSNLRLGVLNQDHFAFEDDRNVDVVLKGRPKLWKAMEAKNSLLEIEHITDEQGHRLAELEMKIADLDGYQGESDAIELLAGLGIVNYEAPLRNLSGGYKLRVLLAQCLFGDPELLLLDEPNNHLDLPSIQWLEGYLEKFPGTALIISHDQHFLNGVTTHIIDIDYQALKIYPGNYEHFLSAKDLNKEQKENEIEKQEKKKEELQRFVDRFKAKATKARQASSKAKQIEKMDEIVIKRSSRRAPNFDFQITRPSGKIPLVIDNLSKSYGENQVLKDLSFSIQRGDRIAVIGANGIGKSTLIKILADELKQDEGKMEWGHEVAFSYFPQDHHDLLAMAPTAYEWLYSFAPGETIGTIRSMLGRALISGDDVHKQTESLSGGEAARLIFAKIMLLKPNLLLLDEPTNHLDLETIQAVAESLTKYKGTILCVSHNRYFIEHFATGILELTRDGFNFHRGNYQDYLDQLGVDHLDKKSLEKPKKAEKSQTPKKNDTNPKDWKQRQKTINRLKKSLKEKEKDVEKVENELEDLEQLFANPEAYSSEDRNSWKELQEKQKVLRSRLQVIMNEWEMAQKNLDQAIELES